MVTTSRTGGTPPRCRESLVPTVLSRAALVRNQMETVILTAPVLAEMEDIP